jgi:hypothetical protein
MDVVTSVAERVRIAGSFGLGTAGTVHLIGRLGVSCAAILMPLGFFLSVTSPNAKKPNGLMPNSDPEQQWPMELDDRFRALREAQLTEPSDEMRENLRRMTSTSTEHVVIYSRPAAHSHRLRWVSLTGASAAVLIGVGLHYLQRFHNAPPPNAVSDAHVIQTG